ncbi:MAG TPA: hypothetical protein VKU82_01235 [Planctomycetaceae bacterium]|nr:hypothetical protein [Planctomycetaceae bacterium]
MKLSEKRFQDGHQQVTSMIEELRDKRRKVFRRLWIASVVLTGASVVALAVELVQRMNFTSATAEAIQADGDEESPRTASTSARARSARPGAEGKSRGRSREAEAYPVRAAAYTSVSETDRNGAWLDGTISDNDSDKSHSGASDDDH